MTITGNTIAANIRVNAQVPFPALVTGSGPVTIAKANGIWTLGLDINDLAPLPVGADPATKLLLLYDQVSGSFQQVAMGSIASFITLSTSGLAILDFGAFPGSADARVTVTGQTLISTAARIETWISPDGGTVDHAADEHLIYPLRTVATNIVPGVGFDIWGTQMDPARDGGAPAVNLTYGKWNIAWRWGN